MTAVLCKPANVSADDPGSRLVTCPIEDLRPHPSLVRLQVVPSARELSDAIAREGRIIRDPLTITQDRYILTGQAEWELAFKKGERFLPCLELKLTEEEALLWLIQGPQRSSRLNDFNRIMLALELEPRFKDRALSNQQLGGQIKGSSILTKADRIDVRAQIATAAGVSVGNVSKVKSVITAALPEILEALRNGEITIHRAATWLRNPKTQLDELRWFRNRRGIERDVSTLLSKHGTQRAESAHRLDIHRVVNGMLAMVRCKAASVFVREVQIPGMALLLSSELVKALENQEELPL